MEKQELELLIISALLHDVATFAKRAVIEEQKGGGGRQRTAEKARDTERSGDRFMLNDLPLPPELEDQRTHLARLASAHHRAGSGDLSESVLRTAICLAAGTSSSEGQAITEEDPSTRLVSIFEQIRLAPSPAVDDQTPRTYYPLAAIETDHKPVPLEEARQSSYQDLWTAFLDGTGRLPCGMGVNHYINSLLSLLEQYTWCIPSSADGYLSGLSLYDHALTTAAIAQALFVFHLQSGGEPGEDRDKQMKLVLLGGDLSGIQPYIFGLDKSQGSGVAKLFRARSFYLQALTRSVVNEVLDRLDLFPVARIMDAGGRFVLLLPASDRVRDVLPDFELAVQRFYFERFQGQLSLNLSWDVQLAEDDLAPDRFQTQLNRFNDSLEKRKLQQFDRLSASGRSPVIDLDYAAYQNQGDCAICHKRPADKECIAEHEKYYDRKLVLCRDCGDQIHQIGRRLPKIAYLIFSREDGHGTIPMFTGQWLRLVDRVDKSRALDSLEIVNIRHRGEFAHQPIATHMPEIKKEDLTRWRGWSALKDRGDTSYYKEDRVRPGDPKTFSLLALDAMEDHPNGPIGRRFLGAFKADVDNLGLIFSVGFRAQLSISKFASLSRMLNLFFCDRLVRKDFPDLYVIFAGGDDLFLMGPWTDTIRFATALREQFLAFVGQRQDISLSAGIAVVKPHLPVHAIAEQAECLLEDAKNRPGKNSIALFATTVGWDNFEPLVGQGKWLHGLALDGSIPKGLLGRLLYYGDERRAFLAGEIKRGIYLSHIAYDFARNLNEKKLADVNERDRLLALQRDDFLMEHIRLPVSYAIYRLRKDS